MFNFCSLRYSPLAPERSHFAVSQSTLVLAIFWPLPLLLEKNTKSIKFCTKIYVKVATILRSKCTSFLLRTKPVQHNWRHFLKSFRK